MKNNLIVLAIFGIGCLAGAGFQPEADMHNWSLCILYALMLQVGIGIGSNRSLQQELKKLSPKMLLVPAATITGTLAFSAAASLLLSQWSVFDCMAVGSGFAYYSLSSILITQFKEPSIGLQLATELGTHRPAEQHHPRNDVAGGRAPHPQILRTSGSHLGRGRELDGRAAALHHALLGQGGDAHRHLPRHPHRPERAFLRESFLQPVGGGNRNSTTYSSTTIATISCRVATASSTVGTSLTSMLRLPFCSRRSQRRVYFIM